MTHLGTSWLLGSSFSNGPKDQTVIGQNGQPYQIVPGVGGPTYINANGDEVDSGSGCDEPAGSCLPDLPGLLALGVSAGSAGWTIDPKDLVLKVTRDCFNKGDGRREVTYQLATQSGNPLIGTYNITEQQSNTSLTPPNPWGQSSNHPELGEINVFNDILQPGLFSSQTVKSTQYFLVSPGGLNIAQWVPISRPGQALSKFNTVVMQGPLSSNPNTVKINGKAAPLCGIT